MRAKKEEIGEFLKEFKRIATKGRGLDIVNRGENLSTLARLGLTKKNCKDEILSLSVLNYSDGPLNDKDRPGNIWIFGKKIMNNEVYIKLKIAATNKVEIAKCISFHVAQHPMNYPFCQAK